MDFSKKLSAFLSVLLLSCFLLSFCALAEPPKGVNALSAALYNVGHNVFLYDKDMEKQVNPASTTKVMTMLVIIDAIERGELALDATFPACDDLYYNVPPDGSTAKIQPGEVLSVRDYLYCAMIVSANEACNALAIYYCGSIEAFTDRMNAMAEQIGCTGTHFANTNGITLENHYVTARDMALILAEAIRHPTFVEIASCRAYTVPATEKYGERYLHSTNRLLYADSEQYYEYAVLGKTGTTDAAGNCLVAYAEKDAQRLIAVVMGAGEHQNEAKKRVVESFTEAKTLFEWGFSEYDDWRLVDSTIPAFTYDTEFSLNGDKLSVFPENDYVVFCSKDELNDRYSVEVVSSVRSDTVKAPVIAGMRFGKVTVYIDGKPCAVIPLKAADTIEFDGRAYMRYLVNSGKIFSVASVGLIILAICGIVIAVTVRKKSRTRE